LRPISGTTLPSPSASLEPNRDVHLDRVVAVERHEAGALRAVDVAELRVPGGHLGRVFAGEDVERQRGAQLPGHLQVLHLLAALRRLGDPQHVVDRPHLVAVGDRAGVFRVAAASRHLGDRLVAAHLDRDPLVEALIVVALERERDLLHAGRQPLRACAASGGDGTHRVLSAFRAARTVCLASTWPSGMTSVT
jgi:hypothetical protein